MQTSAAGVHEAAIIYNPRYAISKCKRRPSTSKRRFRSLETTPDLDPSHVRPTPLSLLPLLSIALSPSVPYIPNTEYAVRVQP